MPDIPRRGRPFGGGLRFRIPGASERRLAQRGGRGHIRNSGMGIESGFGLVAHVCLRAGKIFTIGQAIVGEVSLPVKDSTEALPPGPGVRAYR